MRLDKFIANHSELTRSQARQAIRRARVRLDGQRVNDVAASVSPETVVCLDQQVLSAVGPRYFQLYKPAGFICSTQDPQHPLAISLLAEEVKPLSGLHYAGRLDLDVTGLVLISDDGSWTHALSSPRRRCAKRYRVWTKTAIPEEAERRFEQGLWLRGEQRETLPAELERCGQKEALLTLYEGRYHQVKRMFAAIGAPVLRLHREKIGQIELDPALRVGQFRPLTPSEIQSVLSA